MPLQQKNRRPPIEVFDHLSRLRGCLNLLPLRALSFLELSEGHSRNPGNALSSIMNLSIQFIDLLQSEALGFIDHEVNKCDANEAAASPHEEDLGLQVCVSLSIIDEVWG